MGNVLQWYVIAFLVFTSSMTAHELDSEQKIIFFTVPKAGTHLLIKAIEEIAGEPPAWISAQRYQRVNNEEELFKHPSRFFISHLFPPADEARFLDPRKFKKVLLIRDPRDVMLSFLFHALNKGRWPFSRGFSSIRLSKLSFDEQIREALYCPPVTPKDSIRYAVEWCQDPTLFVVRFEDLVGKKGGGSDETQRATLESLALFMEIPLCPGRLEEIRDALFGGTVTFRSGQIGDWVSSYNEENKALFKLLLGQETIDLGYTVDLNW